MLWMPMVRVQRSLQVTCMVRCRDGALEVCARFAVDAALIKCTMVGLGGIPLTEIESLATQLGAD